MARLSLDTPLFEALGPKSLFLKSLARLDIKTVRDLLWHFPARYEDFSKIYSIADLEPGQQATIRGTVEEVHLGRSWRKQMSIVEATIADETGSIRAVWFNQPYIANTLKVGREANFAGKASLSDEGEIYLSHPAYEIARVRGAGGGAMATETKHTARLVPIYPETQGLTSRGLRFIIQSLLKKIPALPEWLPESTRAPLGFPDVDTALHNIHFPRDPEEAGAARARFSFEDLFLLQIINLELKLKLALEKAPPLATDIEGVKAKLAHLPFELTPSQKKSLWEIIQDIARPRPMNRLLQGDVGSGKTVVAAIAALIAAENGYQTAFMAPTEILARQHFETMTKLLERMAAGGESLHRPVIGLVTGAGALIFYENGLDTTVTKPAMAKKVAAGEVAIIFGTHALIQKSLEFDKLGLVIIDEQHRFGVRERATLVKKRGGLIPHFLSMSATPIPRTLMLTVFGDLDLSLITELPIGRKQIETNIVMPIERERTYQFIREEIKSGRQAFVICPRIEKNGDAASGNAKNATAAAAIEMKSVKEEYERLHKTIFPDLRIAMLHGHMKAKEKEMIMRQFRDRAFDLLVATSVIEVGVDIQNATIMMIEGVERFGLAQLYQFRGRIGRGEHQSYCFLMADSEAKAANARLRAILEAKNGFELAEKDLALRGPGQFFGEIQTGLPDVAMHSLQNPELVKSSREAAVALVRIDPLLKNHRLVREKVNELKKRVHSE